MPFPSNFNRIQSSTTGLAGASDVGDVVLTQTTTLTTTADGLAVSATMTVPANSQLIAFYVDTIVDEAVGGGTATAINITIGTAAAGTQYSSAIDVFAGGRFTPTHTTAQLAAMDDVGTNTSVVATVDPNGTISTTQGVYRITMLYRQSV